jgi:hypothetical protein
MRKEFFQFQMDQNFWFLVEMQIQREFWMVDDDMIEKVLQLKNLLLNLIQFIEQSVKYLV